MIEQPRLIEVIEVVTIEVATDDLLRLQTIKAIINSHKFKGLSSDEPRRVQVLDLYCLTRFESESSGREDVY